MKWIEEYLQKTLFTGVVETAPEPSPERCKRMEALASMVVSIAEAICDTVPKEEPLVLLGRDMWPVLPVLRFQGRKTQYFLWSRLQGQGEINTSLGGLPQVRAERIEQTTKTQWLREVFPGSWVVDTGFAGSIPAAIASIDPTIKLDRCLLVCSSGSLAQLPLDFDHSNVVEKIEHLEKLSGRSVSYSAFGNVLWSRKKGDSGHPLDRGICIVKNYDLLRECGLPDSWARKYSTFTGVTPKERLGLSARERQIHYRQVSFLRGKYPRDQWVMED